MHTLGFIAFGAVDLLIFAVVLTALIWAAVKDGQKQRSVQTAAPAASPLPQAPAPTPEPARLPYPKLAVASR